jgi:predicted nucleic acid-binding protein
MAARSLILWTTSGAIVSVELDLFVLDASAVLRLFLADGPLPPRLEPAVDRGCRGDAWLLAPDLLWIECTSVLLKQVRRGLLSAEEANELQAELSQLPIRSEPASGLCGMALQLATQHQLSAYDALYLALTLREKACLITADQQLQQAAQRCGCVQ